MECGGEESWREQRRLRVQVQWLLAADHVGLPPKGTCQSRLILGEPPQHVYNKWIADIYIRETRNGGGWRTTRASSRASPRRFVGGPSRNITVGWFFLLTKASSACDSWSIPDGAAGIPLRVASATRNATVHHPFGWESLTSRFSADDYVAEFGSYRSVQDVSETIFSFRMGVGGLWKQAMSHLSARALHNTDDSVHAESDDELG